MTEPKPLTCSTCGKKFLCKARATGKYPKWKPDCETIEECDCEDCHTGNKNDPMCGNVKSFNPSSRINWKKEE